MGLSVKYLPRATPLDPAEDPPSSIDPLGTMGTAERIAEILFPGITARMWRPRLLTFSAVAAIIAKRVMVSRGDSEDSGMNARLALERLFVSSVIRQQVRDPDAWGKAARRLPGSLLARRALHSGDTPLGRSNFLKGQAIFGPFGVMARLARNLGIVDEDDALGRNGEELLMAWSADEQLKGILDEDNSGSSGRQWINRVSQATADHLFEEQWRSSQWSGWQELAEPLRLDNIGGQERIVLKRLLGSDPIRGRCIELLCMPDVKALYRAAKEEGRGEQDRRVLVEAFLPELMAKEHYEDGIIELAVQLADSYEEGASYLETAFNCLRWALTKRGGQAKPSEIEADKQLQPVFHSICRQIKKTSLQLRDLTGKVPAIPEVADRGLMEPLDVIIAQLDEGSENPTMLIDVVMNRHREVQASKDKVMWIEPGERWMLMPGFGLSDEEPPRPDVKYLHAFRVPNVYSFLADLGLTGIEVPDGEA